MRHHALIAATVASLAACGAPVEPYDPQSDTTRGVGDAGAWTTVQRPEDCQPGLLFCGRGGGVCTPPSNAANCGRCGTRCPDSAPRCVASGTTYVCAP